jgi:DnaB helicase-like protein/Toprim domain-containing protein
MAKLTEVEKYVVSKGWDYRDAGDNIAIEYCPFCKGDDYKFFINVDNWLWDCKRGSCGLQGNEYKLKSHLGDWVPKSQFEEPEQQAEEQESSTRRAVKKEGVPDVLKAHKWLLESSQMMNYLDDTRGWDSDIIKQMKIGMMNRYIRDESREVGCFTYPYFINGKPSFVKFRTLPGEKKNFSGLSGHDAPLYNQDVVKKGIEYLVCCEGEADTISVLSIGETNVVGVPGASTKKAVWADLLNFPGKMYLLFDNDEDGQAGAKEFAKRFGEDRFWNVVIPEFDLVEPTEDKHGDLRTKGKDITEWLMTLEGNKEAKLAQFKELLATGEQFVPEGIQTVSQALREERQNIINRGTTSPTYLSPWPSLNRIWGGAEDGYLIIIQAPQKHLKTTFTLNWAEYFVQVNKVNVIFECKEMPQSQLARKWASYVTGTADEDLANEKDNYRLPVQSAINMLDKAIGISLDREEQILFGYQKIISLDEEMARMRSSIRRFNAKVWIYDNLQWLVNKLGPTLAKSANRANFMGTVTNAFKELSMETKTLGILVAQTRGIGDEDLATSKTLEGSSQPGNDCDAMLIFNRTLLMPVKNKTELAKLGQNGVNVLTSETFSPELYINCGLTRSSPGGQCVLMSDGARSLIHERDAIAMEAAQKAGANSAYVGGTLFKYAEDKTKPIAEELPAPQVSL